MNDWSKKRKRTILLIVFGSLLIIVVIPLIFLFYEKPTCFDGKKNGDERGVDCGGSCELICSPESLPLLSKGDPRILTVSPSVYEVAAIFDNPNVTGEVYRAPYTIKLFETGGVVPIKIIEGSVYIPPNSQFAVFEGPFELGERVPSRVTLEWKTQNFIWKNNTNKIPSLDISKSAVSKEDERPRIDALVTNNTLQNVSNIELTVLVSDALGNTIAASKTFIDKLDKGESMPVVFVWPVPWNEKSATFEIISRILPDRSFLR